MDKVIQLPVKELHAAEKNLVRLVNSIRSNLIQLSEYRKQLLETKKELRKLEARLRLKVVRNADNEADKT